MSAFDDVYRERAQLVALIASLYPAYMTPSLDIADNGWWTIFVYVGLKQLTWHISPTDLDLFGHVKKVTPTDPFVQWDGHSTTEKYRRIQDYIKVA
jgi:hypothetical protein